MVEDKGEIDMNCKSEFEKDENKGKTLLAGEIRHIPYLIMERDCAARDLYFARCTRSGRTE